MSKERAKHRPVSRIALGAATLALATAFTLTPAMVQYGPFDDAAYAKGKSEDRGNKGGDRGQHGGGNGNKGDDTARGKSGEKGKRGGGGSFSESVGKLLNFGQSKKAAKSGSASTSTEDGGVTLHARDRGKWNSMNANPRALDAHVANGNTNGPIGAMAQLRTAARAANGEELSDQEVAFLEGLGVDFEAGELEDQELADLLNGEEPAPEDPVFEVEDGVATCVANCDTQVDENDDPISEEQLNADANEAIDMIEDSAQQMEFADFYDASVERISDESNKSYTEEQFDALIGEISDAQNFDLYSPSEDDLLDGEEEEIAAAAE